MDVNALLEDLGCILCVQLSGLEFNLILLKSSKLACLCFAEAGRGQETPGLETEDFTDCA